MTKARTAEDSGYTKPRSGGSRLKTLLIASALFALIATVFGSAILDAAGRYLAPRYASKTDAIIIEGEELIQEGAVTEALRLMSELHIQRIILVIHTYRDAQMGFGIGKRYGGLVAEGLQRAGLKKNQYVIVSVPVAHPITLTEARAVLTVLSKESITSAVLIGRGFHTRRSYLLYRNIGRAEGIEILPWSSNIGYPLINWWHDEDATYDFIAQAAKLAYYLLRGYLPLSSLLQAP